MASKGQKFNSYSDEQRMEIMNKYLSGNYSSSLLSKEYNIPVKTIKINGVYQNDTQSFYHYFFFFLFIISFYGSGFKVIGQLVELQDIITLSAFAFGSCMYLCKELFDGYFIRIKNGLDALKQSKKISDD